MDHAIEYLENYMTMDKKLLVGEWKSGNYERLADCPSYAEVKAYCDAIGVLSKHHYGSQAMHQTPYSITRNQDERGRGK